MVNLQQVPSALKQGRAMHRSASPPSPLRANQRTTSAVRLAIVRSERPVPPRSALKSGLPVSSATQRDWLSIYMWRVCCGRASGGRDDGGGAKRSRATKPRARISIFPSSRHLVPQTRDGTIALQRRYISFVGAADALTSRFGCRANHLGAAGAETSIFGLWIGLQ
jgi:hypothetical protein